MEIGYAQTGSPRPLPNAAPATQAPEPRPESQASNLPSLQASGHGLAVATMDDLI